MLEKNLTVQETKEKILQDLGFVFLPGGSVQLGSNYPLPCRLEGVRKNETPVRLLPVEPFWLAKCCVSNLDFEQFNPKHQRPATSTADNQPVTELTYADALTYITWLGEKYQLNFRLPTEAEWTFAAAPLGWEYPYQQEPQADKTKAHTFNALCPKTIAVADPRYGTNCYGLWHMAGNVGEMIDGYYYAPGHNGAATDGAYYLAKGGSYGFCHNSSGVQRRLLMDVADRSTRIGFRLAHSAF